MTAAHAPHSLEHRATVLRDALYEAWGHGHLTADETRAAVNLIAIVNICEATWQAVPPIQRRMARQALIHEAPYLLAHGWRVGLIPELEPLHDGVAALLSEAGAG